MKFFIDFEATQPGNEIISIGAISEDMTHSFQTMAQPKNSVITQYITQLTGITQEKVDTACSFERALKHLADWCMMLDSTGDWEFHCYGYHDADFVETSAKFINPKYLDRESFYVLSLLRDHLIDDSKEISKFFCGAISLINAYNYTRKGTFEQFHDPLEDAKMLLAVKSFVDCEKPLTEYPHIKENNKIIVPGYGVYPENYKMPSGKFFCKGKGKNAKNVRQFESCDDAINWIIDTFAAKADRSNIRRDRIATKIMVAIERKQLYRNLIWWREK